MKIQSHNLTTGDIKSLLTDLLPMVERPDPFLYPSLKSTDGILQAKVVFDIIRKHLHPRPMTEAEFNEIADEICK